MLEEICACIESDRVPFLIGPPGWGKTAIGKSIGRHYGVPTYLVHLGLKAGNEIHGQPVISRNTMRIDGRDLTVVEQAPPDYAVAAVNEPRGAIIFFDELTQLTPGDQGQALSILTERRIGEVDLPRDRIALIAAGNPARMSAGGWQMSLPMINRLVPIEMTLDVHDFVRAENFPSNWGRPLDPVVKFGRELNIDLRYKARTLAAAWLKSQPQVFNLPSDLSSWSNGFPTPRSVEAAADLYAACVQNGYGIDRQTVLLNGAMGQASGGSLAAFMQLTDLPDPDLVLDNPDEEMAKVNLAEQARVYYLVLSVAGEMRRRNQALLTSKSDGRARKGEAAKVHSSWLNAMKAARWLQDRQVPSDLVAMFCGSLNSPDTFPAGISLGREGEQLIDQLRATSNMIKASGIGSTGMLRMASMQPGGTP